MNRDTTIRDRHRAQIRRAQPCCAICGGPIDYALPHLDPMAYVVDHVIPVARGGLDTIENKQPAHRSCNRAKSARLDGGPVIKRSSSLLHPQGAGPQRPQPSAAHGTGPVPPRDTPAHSTPDREDDPMTTTTHVPARARRADAASRR